jgi:hypothetical protein
VIRRDRKEKETLRRKEMIFRHSDHWSNQQINKSTNQLSKSTNQQINKSTSQINKSTSQLNIILSVLLILLLPQWGVAARLSEEAQISMLTASPGDELYSVFGHSALRVHDPLAGIDEVYNYGTFDFNTPNFYLKFIRGKLFYQLSVSTFRQFLYEYDQEQRAVYEQLLILTSDEKQRIYDFLLVNRLPENRSYLYDFFYDNCATRIRDIVHELLVIDWGEDPYPGPPRSFRDMLQPYLSNMPWAAFGIDLALGLPADRIATPWHYMFLPDEMFTAFAQARHIDGRPLVGHHQVVLQASGQPSSSFPITPKAVTWTIFLIGLASLFNKRFSYAFDKAFFSVLGLTGIVIAVLWFFSDHESTNQNMNLLWAIPTHLYFIFRTGTSGKLTTVRYYYLGVCIVSVLLIVLWHFIPQGFNAAFFPLVLVAGGKALRVAR